MDNGDEVTSHLLSRLIKFKLIQIKHKDIARREAERKVRNSGTSCCWMLYYVVQQFHKWIKYNNMYNCILYFKAAELANRNNVRQDRVDTKGKKPISSRRSRSPAKKRDMQREVHMPLKKESKMKKRGEKEDNFQTIGN